MWHLVYNTLKKACLFAILEAMSLFVAPKFLSMPAVGLDISADAVRFIELENTSRGHRVTRYASRNFPLSLASGGHIREKNKLQGVISQLVKEYKLQFANVALPEEQAYLANIRIPRVAPEEIRSAIELRLEEYIPISGADAVFDYEVVGDAQSKRKDAIDVVVSALPRSAVEEFFEIFTGTGITPRAFEFESQAMARAIIKNGDIGTFLVVDMGKMTTGIFVVAHGVVQFSASLDIGGHYLTQAIEKSCGISYEEAEAIKMRDGLIVREANNAAQEAMYPVMADLKTRLLRHYSYWQTHHGEKIGGNIEGVFLTGGGANLQGITEYLAIDIDVKVNIANPWLNVASYEDYIPPISARESQGYSAAIGLALRNSFTPEQ